ncbi:MAG: UDP-N-acetylmuramate--L-alanine ligase [bacterium]
MDLLRDAQSMYIVGIKGVGMTSLAQVLRARGKDVSGSDVADVFFTDAVLRESGIPVLQGFTAENVPKQVDAVVYSTAYTTDHPELAEAIRRRIPLFTYPEVLGSLLRASEGISIAGTHGKTRTTALCGAILAADGRDPTVIVGSNVPQFHGNARIGSGPLLVVETDEYQNKFTHYAPRHCLITSIEYDHPDFFPSAESYVAAFERFLERIPPRGILVTNADDQNTEQILGRSGQTSVRFGTKEDADVRLCSSVWRGNREVFLIRHRGHEETFTLQMPGRHNALNACAAVALCRELDVRTTSIRKALEGFAGIKRRFEFLGSTRGALVFDDYAHHPSEISAAIAAARECFPQRRLVVVFQPHTYSRTQALLPDFAQVLRADLIILLEVYGSAREKRGTVSSSDILSAMHPPHNAVVQPTLDEAAAFVQKELRENDLLLLLGAGDAWKLGEALDVKKNVSS